MYMIFIWYKCPVYLKLHIFEFQTTTELRRKYAKYLTTHGHPRSKLYTNGFDAFWTAAKTLNASTHSLLQINESIEHFSYDNKIMANVMFDSLTKLQFEGASVRHESIPNICGTLTRSTVRIQQAWSPVHK